MQQAVAVESFLKKKGFGFMKLFSHAFHRNVPLFIDRNILMKPLL